MVLICGNNSPLTIEQFHKNRCVEKAEVKQILVERKYRNYQGEEKPKQETPVVNNSYSKSITAANALRQGLNLPLPF